MHITWFGHSAFALQSGGHRILIDPFLTGNPRFEAGAGGDVPAHLARTIAGTTEVVVTHAHADHVGDCLAIAKETGAPIFCNWELGQWLGARWEKMETGKSLALELMNTGGAVTRDGATIRLVRADHSSGVWDNGVSQALGLANGAIISIPDAPVVYHMGDTDIFSDMALIEELYKPDIVIVPIGDRFTMGPSTAALAVRRYFPRSKAIIPCHFGTFSLLTGTVEEFKRELGPLATHLLELEAGQPARFSIA